MGYLEDQLNLKSGEFHYGAAQYVKTHHMSLLDFDCWAHVEDLLNREISYDDYHRLDQAIAYDLLTLDHTDVVEIKHIIGGEEFNECRIYTVSIKDREDPDMDIWTASFTTEEAALKFKAEAEAKLKKYDVFNTVDVVGDCSYLNDCGYLAWIDDRYGGLEDE